MISKFWFPKTQLLKKEENKKTEKDPVSHSLDKTNNGKQPRRKRNVWPMWWLRQHLGQ